MGCPLQEEYIFYRGERFQVEFYFTQRGEMPAKEYYDESDHYTKVKLYTLVRYMAENGRLFDERRFRLVDKKEKIYEFKPNDERFFNFFWESKRIIITNAYPKKGQKIDRRELERAINSKRDYEFRVKGGIYYETQ